MRAGTIDDDATRARRHHLLHDAGDRKDPLHPVNGEVDVHEEVCGIGKAEGLGEVEHGP